MVSFKYAFDPNAKAVAPAASIPSGTYTGAQSVTLLSSSTAIGANIYYTTDGKDPTIKSTKYSKAISVSKSTTIKAIAVANSLNNSDVSTFEYIITAALPTSDLATDAAVGVDSKITLTCTTAKSTIYYTADDTTPTISSMQYTSPIAISSDMAINGKVTIKAFAVASGFPPSPTVTFTYRYDPNFAKLTGKDSIPAVISEMSLSEKSHCLAVVPLFHCPELRVQHRK